MMYVYRCIAPKKPVHTLWNAWASKIHEASTAEGDARLSARSAWEPP